MDGWESYLYFILICHLHYFFSSAHIIPQSFILLSICLWICKIFLFVVLFCSEPKFPKDYPTGCLLGCVNVTDCLSQEQFRQQVSKTHRTIPEWATYNHWNHCDAFFSYLWYHVWLRRFIFLIQNATFWWFCQICEDTWALSIFHWVNTKHVTHSWILYQMFSQQCNQKRKSMWLSVCCWNLSKCQSFSPHSCGLYSPFSLWITAKIEFQLVICNELTNLSGAK